MTLKEKSSSSGDERCEWAQSSWEQRGKNFALDFSSSLAICYFCSTFPHFHPPPTSRFEFPFPTFSWNEIVYFFRLTTNAIIHPLENYESLSLHFPFTKAHLTAWLEMTELQNLKDFSKLPYCVHSRLFFNVNPEILSFYMLANIIENWELSRGRSQKNDTKLRRWKASS